MTKSHEISNTLQDYRLDRIEDGVKKLDQIISGNGHPEQGLVVKVEKMGHCIDKVQSGVEEINERNKNIRWWFLGIIATVLASMLSDINWSFGPFASDKKETPVVSTSVPEEFVTVARP